MPAGGLHASSLRTSSSFQFAAPKAQASSRSSCQSRKNVGHFASPRPRGRTFETIPSSSSSSSSRIVKMWGVEGRKIREPFRMSLSAAEPVSQADDVSALSHIMEPIHEGDRDLLLVYCPGALKASEKYFPLMHTIQAHFSLRLWIVVLHNTDQEALSSIQIDVSLTGVLAMLKERGFRACSSVHSSSHELRAFVKSLIH